MAGDSDQKEAQLFEFRAYRGQLGHNPVLGYLWSGGHPRGTDWVGQIQILHSLDSHAWLDARWKLDRMPAVLGVEHVDDLAFH